MGDLNKTHIIKLNGQVITHEYRCDSIKGFISRGVLQADGKTGIQ
jgi:hypothetical protein